jgi:hypothetical protein
MMRQNRQTPVEQYVLSIAFDADIEPLDRVVVGSTTFTVESLNDEHTWRIYKRAELTRVEA